MDRNELLAATREKYLQGFLQSVDLSLSRSVEGLFKKADSSYSSLEQARFLDARGILRDRDVGLRLQMHKSMEQLLNRSLQTTYSTFRPSFSSRSSADELALVDATALEDELRIIEITNRFRNEAEEQLRDLNIRIALLFEQDNIRERENPFRPYLLSRSLATAIENVGISGELAGVLITELAEHIGPQVVNIYDAINSHLAGHGIAAQLQMKIKKSPAEANNRAAAIETIDELSAEIGAGQRGHIDNRLNAGGAPGWSATSYNIDTRAMSTDTPKRMVDQLFDFVRGMAVAPFSDDMSSAARQVQRQDGGDSQNQNLNQGQDQDQDRDYARSQGDGPYGGSVGGDHHSGGKHSSQAQTYGAHHDAGQPGGMQSPASSRIAKAGWLSGKQVVGDVLRKFFSGDGVPVGSGAGGEGVSTLREATAQLTNSVDQLIREQTPASAGMVAADGEIRNLVLEQRVNLNSISEDIDEQMTIDIVAMLFEFILRDTQIPAEVRAQLGRLQFLVLKIALLDTSLLTQKGHPARLLVNRIGSISLGLKQVDPSGVRVTAEICRIVETLLSDSSKSTNLFSEMLDEFDAFIAHELRGSDEKVERAVQVVEEVHGRTLRFAHAAAKMSEALLGLTIDPFLYDFLVNAWVQALERAERTDTEQAKRFRLLVPDLLWSIVPKVQEDDRIQLFALLLVILNTLREGLVLTDWTPERQQTLLNWLMDAHTNALRPRNVAQDMPPSLSSIHEHFQKFVDNPEAESLSEVTNRTPAEYKQFLDEAIKNLDIQIQLLDRVFENEGLPGEDGTGGPAPMHGPALESNESVMERLRSGVAIEINLGGKPSVGRLNWIDPNAANMVLTLDQQSTPSVISVRMFRRLYDSGRVNFLETAPLFERAVESLLKSAEKMDRKTS